MRKHNAVAELHRIDPGILAGLATIERLCLLGSGLIGLAGLFARLFPALVPLPFAWSRISLSAAVAILACVSSLELSRFRQFPGARILSRLLAVPAALAGLAELAAITQRTWHGSTPAAGTSPAIVPALAALSYILLAVVLIFVRTSRGTAGFIPDIALFVLGPSVLSLVGAGAFGAIRAFGDDSPLPVATPTICALSLLTFVSFARRAEFGRFSIFLAHGIGSRIARGLVPFLLVLPFLRETARAAMSRPHLLADRYAAAILASLAAMVSVGLLMLIARHIRRMETEIRDLSLRDELTGLYNLRGFLLLADQALRLAQRSELPFSVLFVDVDDLKQINDALGHGVGSRLLVDTAEFLTSSFRETDVLGRVGGDEFAVAGQFTLSAIENAQQRLEAQPIEPLDAGRHRLSLSMGHVTANPREHESLQDLVDRADAAMYRQKRQKKLQAV